MATTYRRDLANNNFLMHLLCETLIEGGGEAGMRRLGVGEEMKGRVEGDGELKGGR